MPYSDLEIAQQLADEISIVESMMVGAPADQALLIAQVVAHLRVMLDGLIDQIDPQVFTAAPWARQSGRRS